MELPPFDVHVELLIRGASGLPSAMHVGTAHQRAYRAVVRGNVELSSRLHVELLIRRAYGVVIRGAYRAVIRGACGVANQRDTPGCHQRA